MDKHSLSLMMTCAKVLPRANTSKEIASSFKLANCKPACAQMYEHAMTLYVRVFVHIMPIDVLTLL